ncbi:MIT domain-containing protein 1 [Anabrus simplex]|uniref:MIT domain-containing protein 1 n=1 Tax=Anabrus simplex TaxID=316456 RepID=UPI0034DDC96B
MSTDKVTSVAASILQRGVELDNKKRYTEALVCYQEGLQLLVDSLKSITDVEKKKYVRSKIESYMCRGEALKKLIEEQKEAGKYHEQILIENNSTGHSYKSLLGRFLDDEITEVAVEDPYIRSLHQCQNFLRLCELLVKSCSNLRHINLLTSLDGSVKDQRPWLENVKSSLLRYNIHLTINFSPTLHDRQIRLSSGWIIKIGRGLDYFKAPDGKFALGAFDLDLRPCHETTVDVFHSKDVKQSYG